MIKGTDAFGSFAVNDIERARTFYHDTLGLDVSRSDEGLTLDVGRGNKIFVYPKPDHTPANFTILNFPVDNVEQAVSELSARGVRFEVYGEGELTTDERGIHRGEEGPRIAWFKDPAGNFLSVLEEK
jgi:catechol 2,3-dioxygenase-like lactoylglutathione lyase family enzyme